MKIIKIVGLVLSYALSYWISMLLIFSLAFNWGAQQVDYSPLFIVPFVLLVQLFFIVKCWSRPKGYFAVLAAAPLLLASILLYDLYTPANPQAQNSQAKYLAAREAFDRSFREDLLDYFVRIHRSENVSLSFELLREGPTVTGMAAPKFYAWTEVSLGQAVEEAGAVRVAETGAGEFEVFDYLSADEMRRDFNKALEIFPLSVAEEIRERLSMESQE